MFMYFGERGRGREREGHTESEAGSSLWAVSTEPDMGFELTNREIMTWAKVEHVTNWGTQTPLFEEHSTKFLTVLLKIVKVIKNKESLKNCHSQKEPKETWQLNVMWHPGAEKEH